jgi:hypothetical protein
MSASQAPLPRHNLYGPVHKGLRLALSGLLIRLGATDFEDAVAGAATLAALRDQLSLGASHLDHEEAAIHPRLAARSAQAAALLDQQHQEHHQAFAELDTLMAALETAEPAHRGAAAMRLYLRFSVFVADDFAHMAHEETVVNPLLWSLFDDAELMAMEGEILASIPPDEHLAFTRLMIAAMNLGERAAFLGAIRASAPEEAFQGVLDGAARAVLPANDWQALAGRLGLAA